VTIRATFVESVEEGLLPLQYPDGDFISASIKLNLLGLKPKRTHLAGIKFSHILPQSGLANQSSMVSVAYSCTPRPAVFVPQVFFTMLDQTHEVCNKLVFLCLT